MAFKPDLFFKVLARPVMYPLESGLRKILRQLNPKVISLKVARAGSGILKGTVQGSPASLDQYFLFRSWYVAKKLLLVVVVLVLLLPLLYVNFVHPELVRRFGTPQYYVSSAELADYSGGAKILDLEGNLLYSGPVVAGLFQGFGELYYANGLLAYKGGFVEQDFEGAGELYFDNGQLQYKGSFARNYFDGYGTLYNRDGTLLYKGYFVNNLYQGLGAAYDEQTGELIYEGEYLQGVPHGYGVSYSGGEVTFKGTFTGGQPVGAGTLYTASGGVAYEGGLKDGLKDGEGTLYNDEGQLVYKGQFAGDLYEGSGQLFDDNGTLLYRGSFMNGVYFGPGELFNQYGFPVYEGEFNNGFRHGLGKAYTSQGRLMYEGVFAFDSMDFGYMLGFKGADILTAFPMGGRTEGYVSEESFCLSMEGVGLGFVLRPAPTLEEAAVEMAAVWGDQNFYGFQNGVPLSEIRAAVGEPYAEGPAETGAAVAKVLENEAFLTDAHYMGEIQDPRNLYQARFYFDAGGLEVVTYSSDAGGGVLFFTVAQYRDAGVSDEGVPDEGVSDAPEQE